MQGTTYVHRAGRVQAHEVGSCCRQVHTCSIQASGRLAGRYATACLLRRRVPSCHVFSISTEGMLPMYCLR
jgi:hypothetical protein